MSDAYQREVINFGDDISEMLGVVGENTWANRQGRYGEVNASSRHFRGVKTWSLAPLLEVPEPHKLELNQDADGIGTKVLVNQRTAKYDTAGIDLMAMASDDPAAKGLEPVTVTTVLSLNRWVDDPNCVAQLGQGILLGCNRTGVAMVGGETAILGNIIQGYGDPSKVLWFDWSATVHSVGHRDRIIDGREIEPGMSLVGFHDPGFRSNGISAVRRVFEHHFGENWHNKQIDFESGLQKLGDVALRPSVIYTPVLVAATGGYDLRRHPEADFKGAAHITGGGIQKLADLLLTSGCGADIEDPFTPPEAMRLLRAIEEMSDHNIYSMLHMGQAMVLATFDPNSLIDLAHRNDVEAKVIGLTTKRPGIKVRSAGSEKPGQILEYSVAA